MADVITTEMGSPTSFSNLAQSPAPWMQIEAFLGIARDYPWEEMRDGVLGMPVMVRREPVGVVAAIPPWNVPAVHDHVQGRPGAARRLHRRGQARARRPRSTAT